MGSILTSTDLESWNIQNLDWAATLTDTWTKQYTTYNTSFIGYNSNIWYYSNSGRVLILFYM
jgi:hypothetical protein